MSTDVQPPSKQASSDPPAEPPGSQWFGRGPDAGLYFIGVIAVLAFISLIGVLFWVASRENSASVAVAPVTATPSPEKEEGVVLLPIISGESTVDAVTQKPTPMTSAMASPIVEETNSLVATQTSNLASRSPVPTSPTQPSHTPDSSQQFTTVTPSPTHRGSQTQTATTTANQTPTATYSGEMPTLFIRNDQGCVDPRNYDLYIFGEIVNNSPVSVDILNWDIKIYDNGREIQTDDIFLDIPNNYAVFANSSIPFALLTTLDRPGFTNYDISLDFVPGAHSPRRDLSIVEYSSAQTAGYTEIIGKWSHTDLANPPNIIWIIATIHDSQGKLTNLQYQHYTNASVVDPRLPAGQHSFRQLYLEDNPCGGGTITVSILGE